MAQENRNFFRINVKIPFCYQIIPAQEAEETPASESSDARFIQNSAIKTLKSLEDEANEIIALIGEKSSLMAKALSVINKRVTYAIDSMPKSNDAPVTMVNISAGGMAFDVNEAPNENDKVDVFIQPSPDIKPIVTRCKIVKILPPKFGSQGCSLALEFESIVEADRSRLTDWVNRKQLEDAAHEREASRFSTK
ncbi:PilZ domain-containing protein [Thiomicrorhabdus arctica]|uniref:PilZ domain-containing protein n=1 Tax=Thiomicrorhabdus arctica TaxID=131540 RepID=UPI00036D4373|nr:PilZ domain-containing protein [Thiomicrorhabdus arctica]